MKGVFEMKRKINVRNIFEKNEEKIWLTCFGAHMACGMACLIGKKLGVEKQVTSVVLPIELVNVSIGAYGLYVNLTEEE